MLLILLLQVFPPPTPVVNVHPASPGLPLWMQIASFAVATVLAIMKVIEFFRRGTLEVRITRDCFFRLSESGESLFIHGGMIARNGPVLVQGVSVIFKRLASKNSSIAAKTFPMDIIDIGEKIKGSGFRAEHHFYGASPLLYVNAASTFRPVYHCTFPEHRERQAQSFTALIQELQNYKRDADKLAAEGHPRQDASVIQDVEQIIKPHYNTMCGLIQVEAGDYEIALTITYEKCGFPSQSRTVSSFAYLTINETSLSQFKTNLQNVLRVSALNLFKDKPDFFIYPELQPKITESERRRIDQGLG